jgi:23S rRNA (uracil1939-C5)-methyltransferase
MVVWTRQGSGQRGGPLERCVSRARAAETSTRGAEALYELVRQAAALRPDRTDVVLDLYCGTGSIGLCLADAAALVVGVESVGERGQSR